MTQPETNTKDSGVVFTNQTSTVVRPREAFPHRFDFRFVTSVYHRCLLGSPIRYFVDGICGLYGRGRVCVCVGDLSFHLKWRYPMSNGPIHSLVPFQPAFGYQSTGCVRMVCDMKHPNSLNVSVCELLSSTLIKSRGKTIPSKHS